MSWEFYLYCKLVKTKKNGIRNLMWTPRSAKAGRASASQKLAGSKDGRGCLLAWITEAISKLFLVYAIQLHMVRLKWSSCLFWADTEKCALSCGGTQLAVRMKCSYRVSNQPLSPSVSCLLFRWRRCPFFSCFRSLPLCSHHGIKVTPFIQMTALLVYLGILYIGNFHFLSRKFIIFSVVPFGKCTKNIWWYPQDPQG